MSYHSESALKSINRRSYFPNACRISGYFDTKFIIIAQIEPILQKSKDTKIYNILNLEQVYFLVTCVKIMSRRIWVSDALDALLSARIQVVCAHAWKNSSHESFVSH